MKEANEKLDPTFIQGFTNVVHEIFTIYPSGKVEREVLDARSTGFDAWKNPNSIHRQILHLSDEGINHGKV